MGITMRNMYGWMRFGIILTDRWSDLQHYCGWQKSGNDNVITLWVGVI
jgi:hypothetical protein